VVPDGTGPALIYTPAINSIAPVCFLTDLYRSVKVNTPFWVMEAGIGEAEIKTKVLKDRWVAEIRIPFRTLGGKPKDGEEWKLNIARSRKVEGAEGQALVAGLGWAILGWISGQAIARQAIA